MKRFLSIALCVMMLVSVFSIGASAMVPTSEEVVITPAVPEIPYVNQDFSDAEDLEFTEVHGTGFGTPAVIEEPGNTTNKVMQLTTDAKAKLDAATLNTVLSDNDKTLNIEFRVYPVGQAETISVGVCMPALLEATDDKDTYARENYYIINSLNFNANAWNTVKVEMHISDSYSVSNVSYPESANTTASATVTVNNAELTCVPGSAGNTAAAGKYTVKGNYTGTGTTGLDKDREVELAYIAVSGVVAGLDTTAPADGRKVYLDDIKIYKPGVAAVTEDVDYPITSGNIYLTVEDAASYTGTGSSTAKTELAKHALTTNSTAAENVITVDLKNTVAGGPLTIHFGKTDGAKYDGSGNGTGVGAVNIASNDTIGRDWATYKIHFRQAGYNDPYKVYRKGANETTYTELAYGTDWSATRSGGTGRNQIIFYYQPSLNLGAGSENTVWEVKNLQVTDLCTLTGKAVAENNELTVSLNTMINSNADVIVATYAGDKLANVSYVPYAKFADTATITVPYTTGNTVKLYIWDGIATGVPVLSNPIPITVQ